MPMHTESIGYRHSACLPGVEILDAEHAPRTWEVYNTSFALALSESWSGGLSLEGRTTNVAPGEVILTAPGDVHVAAPNDARPGTLRILMLTNDALRAMLSEVGWHAAPTWRQAVVAPSPALRSALVKTFRTLSPGHTPMQQQSRLLEVVSTLVPQLVGSTHLRLPDTSAMHRAAERIRESILGERDDLLDLDSLARTTGLSRFQVVRAFKRRFGVPPHAYQILVRVYRGRELLRQGMSGADVAAACGFTDQSHFIRHFRRVLGVTPTTYVACTRASRTLDERHLSSPS